MCICISIVSPQDVCVHIREVILQIYYIMMTVKIKQSVMIFYEDIRLILCNVMIKLNHIEVSQ